MGTTSNEAPGAMPPAETKPEAKEEAAVTAPSSITVADFAKIDLRVGTILTAERVPDADKILKLEVDFGDLGKRTIAAGIGQDYVTFEKLLNTQVVAVVNLPPRSLRGVESNGMILAARGSDGKLSLVTCAGTNGSKVG